MLFSQRKGLKPVQKKFQIDSIDDDLRNGLWNVLHLVVWERYHANYGMGNAVKDSNLGLLFIRYWHSFFKFPVDNLPHHIDDAIRRVREIFFKMSWNEVYDFIEFTVQNAPSDFFNSLINSFNNVLERENSGYRFIEGQLTQITSESEIESIETAMHGSSSIKGLGTHIEQALHLLSDRKNPDYRNSIKESISAVEALVKRITKNDKATLGEALKLIDDRAKFHPAFKKSLDSLYGYTSDANGIRHSLLEESALSFADAKFMLVVCTAFINYTLGKVSELGISIK